MLEREHRVALRDGTKVVVRPIRADDKERLVDGLERLSPESRYRRFLRPVKSLSERELAYLTEIDYSNHFAWVALTPGRDPKGLGVARYVRDPLDPETAEAAVTVVDDHQGRGLGTLLTRLLIATAWEHGIRMFRGWVLGDNVEMLRPIERLGGRRIPDQGVLRVEIDLAAAFGGETLEEALRAVGASPKRRWGFKR